MLHVTCWERYRQATPTWPPDVCVCRTGLELALYCSSWKMWLEQVSAHRRQDSHERSKKQIHSMMENIAVASRSVGDLDSSIAEKTPTG